MVKRLLGFLLAAGMLLQVPVVTRVRAEEETMMNKTYRMWYDEEAPQTLKGFEQWSIPIGNGYMGLNVFGGVSTELISVTENSMANPWTNCNKTSPGGEERMLDSYGGLNLMAKTFIDFDHSDVSNYQRELILNDAIARVSYDYNGVSYTREYFSTHPDKVSVMRLTASQPGELTFTLRPVAPYVYDYLNTPGDGMGKTGKTVANGDTLVVKGMMDWYDINYEGLYKVIPQGGTMVANNDENGENGTITVTGADSAIILLAVGTNYHMVPESFVSGITGVKMDANEDPHEKVQGYLDAAAAKTYDQLLKAHLADHREYFDRASLDLGGVASTTLTTDQLLANYNKGVNDPYLEELTFQYARYLLIASNREGCLPANLQGIWTYGDTAAWSAGYWHNINQQMNYWPAFSTNLIDLFQSYVDLNETFRPTAQKNADYYLTGIKSPTMAQAGTGQNGWALATNVSPYRAGAPGTTGHSGPGTGAFTSLLFWDYYDFTRDETILEEHTYPALEGMANFLSKTLKEYDDGKWLVASSASPENANSYRTVGTAFDQQMVYENHLMTLRAADALGYSQENNPLLTLLNEQLDKLDPVNVGYSGQVKEYREENYYGEIGDPKHRHISQLVGLYPGTSINGTTEAWLDAAAVSLSNRGTSKEGWGKAHRALCWARVQDADKSYELIRAMFRDNTANNLFGIYHPGYQIFQIDSNCGYTAAVAEMLVQSHAGYLEFLPALPSQWDTGSLRGFTTRGAFEVDASWKDGQAKEFVIRSKAGSDCSVKYQNIATATVTDSKGNPVAFTAEGTDLIHFATKEGETYTITGMSPVVKVAAPTNLQVSESDSGMLLSWNASADAVSYNVYRAVNDAPTYEQIATGVSATTYNYAPQDVSGADRITLRITAVGESGRESTGTLAYSLPVAPPEKAEGKFFGQDLQVEISGGEGELYRVYEDGVAVCETAFHIAVVENASPEKTYTVSSVADGRVSTQKSVTIVTGDMLNRTQLIKALEKFETTSGGTPLARITAKAPAEAALTDPDATQIQVDQATRDLNNAMTQSNILKKRPITATIPPFGGYATYSIEKMVDENSETRYAGVDQNTSFTATVTLDGTYHIEAVFVQEYLNKNTITRGKDVTIEVYDGTKWVTALAGGCLTSTPDVPNTYPATTAFILDKSYTGNQLRVTFTNNEAKLCTVFELQAYGQKVNGEGVSLSDSVLTVCSGVNLPLTANGNVASWESSDEEVVSVENGKLKAVGTGTATVTATGTDGSKASCFVTVVDAAPANGVEVYSGGKLVYSYKSFAEAAENAAACDGIVKLKRNVEEEVTIQGDLWVDLNGFDLSGITVTGTVYGMDSATNGYTAENAGSLSLAGGKVAVSTKTTTANAGAVRRYLAVEEEGVYSFHRFYFGITHISMNPETAGMGYRATFAGSEAVKGYLDSFGLIASVNGVPADLEDGVLAAFAPSEFAQEGKTVTKRVLIRNILEEDLPDEELTQRGQTVISAVSFLQTKQGDVILSSAQERSLQAMFEALDVNYRTYDLADRKKLMTLYAKYESLMAEWEIPNLKKAGQ